MAYASYLLVNAFVGFLLSILGVWSLYLLADLWKQIRGNRLRRVRRAPNAASMRGSISEFKRFRQ